MNRYVRITFLALFFLIVFSFCQVLAANIREKQAEIGYNCTAGGDYSTAMGKSTTASGDYSTAMGLGSEATHLCSTAMGYFTTASDSYSTAMGYHTTASERYSTAMGYFTTASGWNSTAMGCNTTASGDYSFVGGRYMQLSADADHTFVWGYSNAIQSISTANAFLIFPAGTAGKVGIGTSDPNRDLTIQGTGGTYLNVKANTGLYEVLLGADSGGGVISTMTDHDLQLRAGGNVTRMIIKKDGKVGIGMSNPNYPLKMASGAHVTEGGVWTDASSRDYKENIRDLSYKEAILALSALSPSKFNYKIDKDDEYLGFIAEDVPDLVATKDRKGLSPMDIVAVLTKVVQQQQKKIEKQQTENAVLLTKLAEVLYRIEALEKQ